MMARLIRTAAVAIVVAASALVLSSGAGASGTCVPGTVPQRACPLTGSASGLLHSGGAHLYYKLWASKGTEIRLTVTNPQLSSELLVCAAFDTLDPIGGPCSYPENGFVRPATQQVTAHRTGIFYLSVYTEKFTGNGTQPYTVKVLANPGVRWPPPCVVPRLPHDTFLSVAKSRLRANGCHAGRVRYVRSRHTHGGDVVSLGLRPGSIHPRGTRVAITVARR